MSAFASIAAARSIFERDRSVGFAALNELFRAGSRPDPLPDGEYTGELVALDVAPGLNQLSELIMRNWMPWQGKSFDSSRSTGRNIFTRDSLTLAHVWWPLYRGYTADGPDWYGAFEFRTSLGPGFADPDCQVLKLDYNIPANPSASIRRVLDEVVQVDTSLLLGKAHLKWWWGKWQLVAYFSLEKIRNEGGT